MSTHKKIRCDKLADDDGKAPDSVLLLSLLIRAHKKLSKRDRYCSTVQHKKLADDEGIDTVQHKKLSLLRNNKP
jgi:hypothetical protein